MTDLVKQLVGALELAVRQGEHDMLLTGEELRQCNAALTAAKAGGWVAVASGADGGDDPRSRARLPAWCRLDCRVCLQGHALSKAPPHSPEGASMTKTPAMPEPLGWYVVNNIGMATLCSDKQDATQVAVENSIQWPNLAPHRAMQLCDAGALQSAQPAGHSCVFHAAPLTPGETRGPQFAVCAICGQPPRVLATQPAAPQGVIAWAHPDGRVVPASTKEHSSRDGGAMASSLAGYTIPCVAAQPAEPEQSTRLRGGVPEVDMDDLPGHLAEISIAVCDGDNLAAQSGLRDAIRLIAAAQAKGGEA